MASVGGSAKVFKYGLFAFNLIFVLAGLVCLAVGIWLTVDKTSGSKLHQLSEAAKNEAGDDGKAADFAARMRIVQNAGIIFIVGGVIVLFIAFLGCCGAIKEWRPLLIFYAACLLIILAIELSAAIYVAVNQKSMETAIQNGLTQTMVFYGKKTGSEPSKLTKLYNDVMKEKKCCGVTASKQDFAKSAWRESNVADLPGACCGKHENEICDLAADSSIIYKKGCYQRIKEDISSRTDIVIGVGIAVGLIQIVGIVFALCLCKAISKNEE